MTEPTSSVELWIMVLLIITLDLTVARAKTVKLEAIYLSKPLYLPIAALYYLK